MNKILSFTLLFSFVFISYSYANLQSTFDASMEGWRGANDVTLSWKSTEGNPDGFLQGNDWSDGRYWYFVSPLAWSGDWSLYIGGELSFDLKIIDSGNGNYFNTHEIIIKSDNGNLYWDGNHPTGSWTHYELLLEPSTFGVVEADFLNVMNEVEELWIRGEYTYGHDIEGLDNVSINAVPIPGAIYLLSFGLFVLSVIKKKYLRIASFESKV